MASRRRFPTRSIELEHFRNLCKLVQVPGGRNTRLEVADLLESAGHAYAQLEAVKALGGTAEEQAKMDKNGDATDELKRRLDVFQAKFDATSAEDRPEVTKTIAGQVDTVLGDIKVHILNECKGDLEDVISTLGETCTGGSSKDKPWYTGWKKTSKLPGLLEKSKGTIIAHGSNNFFERDFKAIDAAVKDYEKAVTRFRGAVDANLIQSAKRVREAIEVTHVEYLSLVLITSEKPAADKPKIAHKIQKKLNNHPADKGWECVHLLIQNTMDAIMTT